VGDQFTVLAFPLAAVIVLHASPSQMGILQALGTLPFLLLGLVAGVWADRYRRRRLMILSDVSRALLLLSVPLAFLLGSLSIYLLYVVTFGAGMFTVVFDVTYQAYLPSLVDPGQLIDANGRLQGSASVASVVGPGLAGSLISVVAAPFAILFDSLSFIWSALSLGSIKKKEALLPRDSRRPILQEIGTGLGLVLHNGKLRSIAACTATSNLFSSIIGAVVVLYAVERLGMTPFLIGTMFALASLGSVLGALAARGLAVSLKVGPLIMVSALVSDLGGLLVIPAVPPYGGSFLIAAYFVMSFGGVVYNINQVSYRQALVPVSLQGRLNATMRFIVWGTLPIGALLGGVIGQAVGLYPALVVGAIGGSFSFLWLVFSQVRDVKSIPTSPEIMGG
jgi:MFS family permease